MTQGSSLQLAASPPSTPLSCIELAGGYGQAPVIRDFSFSFQAGSVYGLLGSNGAGKSTLLRLLAAVLLPGQGRIELETRSLSDYRARERARLLALVPQLPPPALPLSVAEALALARYAYGDSRDSAGPHCIDAAAAALGLEDLLAARCDELSGGQWRRVLVAQGLAQLGPQGGVLLLDEPGAYLDPPARAQLFERLTAEARQHGRCIIVTLHDLPAAGEHCDLLLLLKDGRLLASGESRDMLQPALLAELYSAAPAVARQEVA